MPQANKTNKINSIMIVAGELSGDQVGASLVTLLKKKTQIQKINV